MKTLLLTALVLAGAGFAQVTRPEHLKYPELKFTPPKVAEHRFLLANGITAFVVEDKKLPVFDVTVRFRTGGLLETASEKGIASVTAMLLEEGGTKSVPADSLDELLEFHALSFSSDAGNTGASVTLSGVLDKMDVGLDLLSRVLREPAFDNKKLDLIKKRLKESIQHRFDTPKGTLSIAAAYAVWGKSPISELLSVKDVDKITREEIARFFKTYYRPENMVVGISGRLDMQEALKKLNTAFGAWPKSGRPETVFPVIQPACKKSFYFLEKDINQSYVKVALPVLKRPDPDYYALVLANWVLGGASFTSRISKKVREEEGLAYTAGSSLAVDYFYPGVFGVYLETKSATTAYALDLVFTEIRTFLKDGALESELNAGKQSLIDAFPANFENGKATTDAFVQNHYVKESDDRYDRFPDRIRAVTLSDIKRVAEKYIRPDSMTICVVGKYAECERGDKVHKALLTDFGPITRITEKELNKRLGGE